MPSSSVNGVPTSARSAPRPPRPPPTTTGACPRGRGRERSRARSPPRVTAARRTRRRPQPALVVRLGREAQISGRRRHVSLEEDPAVGRDRSRRRRAGAASTERPTPPGARPARPAAAGSGRRGGRALRATEPTAIASASETWPASSTKSVSNGRSAESRTTREEPGRAGDELEGRRRALTSTSSDVTKNRSSKRDLGSSAGRLLGAAEREALLARLALDSAEQVVDRLVAERRDADALAGAHQRDRHLRALPGLPRARRPLHEEVARRSSDERRVDGTSRSSRARARRRSSSAVSARVRRSSPSAYARAKRDSASRCSLSGSAAPGMSARGSGSSARVFDARDS